MMWRREERRVSGDLGMVLALVLVLVLVPWKEMGIGWSW